MLNLLYVDICATTADELSLCPYTIFQGISWPPSNRYLKRSKLASTRLCNKYLLYTSQAVMAVGDGGNDFELVLNCGVGVAMANAIPKVSECSAQRCWMTNP